MKLHHCITCTCETTEEAREDILPPWLWIVAHVVDPARPLCPDCGNRPFVDDEHEAECPRCGTCGQCDMFLEGPWHHESEWMRRKPGGTLDWSGFVEDLNRHLTAKHS